MRTRTVYACLSLVFLSGLVGGMLGSGAHAATLLPADLPSREWRQFEAEGYSARVCGVVYRTDAPPTNGMPVGGVDTGCLDLEADGLLGFCTLFNSHVPRRGPIGLPYLGVATGGQTWVLCKPRAEAGTGLVSLSEWQLDTILGPHQRLWAPGPAALPAWFKSVGELPYDVPAGRVACHSPAVLRWTSPVEGELRIVGGLWLTRHLDRPQLWELRKSGELLTSGRLEWGPTSQAPLSLAERQPRPSGVDDPRNSRGHDRAGHHQCVDFRRLRWHRPATDAGRSRLGRRGRLERRAQSQRLLDV